MSVLPTILRMAAPNLVVVVVQALSSTIDAFFVGRLGTEALAGVSLVHPAWMLMVTMSAGGMGGGIASAVARAIGRGRRDQARRVVVHALGIAIVFGAVFSGVLLGFGEGFYAALGGHDETLAAALAYSNFVFAGAIAVWTVNAFASCLRGTGAMLVPAIIIVTGELLHVALSPALIFGFGPLPQLGVAGAGLSLALVNVLRALVLGAYVLSRRSGLRPERAEVRLNAGVLTDILRVGVPGALNTVLTNLNVIAVTSLVAPFGTVALAGYGLGTRLEYLQIPLVFGLGAALVTLVGTNVGAGDRARALRVAWVGATLAAAVTGSVGLLAAVVPRAWIGLFSADPGVLDVGETYLRIVGPTYALFGLGLALYFASQGTGRLLWPLLIGGIRLGIVAGGGWLAATYLGGGLVPIFGAIALGMVTYGVLMGVSINRSLRTPTPATPLAPPLPTAAATPR